MGGSGVVLLFWETGRGVKRSSLGWCQQEGAEGSQLTLWGEAPERHPSDKCRRQLDP